MDQLYHHLWEQQKQTDQLNLGTLTNLSYLKSHPERMGMKIHALRQDLFKSSAKKLPWRDPEWLWCIINVESDKRNQTVGIQGVYNTAGLPSWQQKPCGGDFNHKVQKPGVLNFFH